MRIEGYAGRNIPVQLKIKTPDDETQYVGPIDVVADEPNQQVRVQLSYTPPKAGQYKLTMIAQQQPGEQIVENNELSAYLTVLDGGLRILYLDGNLGWPERKFIRRAIDESPDMQLDLWLDTRQDRSQPLSLPIDDFANYDAFLIGDIDATSIGSENAFAMANLVSDGKGLMMLGGVQSFAPGGYATSSIGKTLPVKLDRLKRQSPSDPVRRDAHYDFDLPLAPVNDHFLGRLTAPQANRELWSRLPPLQGANRFRELEDDAQVLLQSTVNGEEIPILVAGQFGTGRVLAMAGDSTFRWYRRGFEDEHRRFWRQCMLWLAKKDDAAQDDVWLKMPRRRFTPGEKAPFTVGVQDESGVAVEGVEFEIELKGPENFFRKIRVTKEDDHFAGITTDLTAPGDYEFLAKATRGGQSLGETRGGFLVINQDLELVDPAANPQMLSALSQLTSDAGGRLLAAEELEKVLQELSSEELANEVAFQSKWQLADSTADAGFYFGLLVLLLIVEWFLRKLWGLV
ncbi:MAG: glutamine amidotransferase [Planctomycetota bacterium]